MLVPPVGIASVCKIVHHSNWQTLPCCIQTVLAYGMQVNTA